MTPEEVRQLELIEQDLETTDPDLVILAERVAGTSLRDRLRPVGVIGAALGCAAVVGAVVILFGEAGAALVVLGTAIALVVRLCHRTPGTQQGPVADGPTEERGGELTP